MEGFYLWEISLTNDADRFIVLPSKNKLFNSEQFTNGKSSEYSRAAPTPG
ncbi:hypothetical protein ASZ90_005635 [hydrocarbon metagenome]|uniref:Uncharacterized protein n=1 Tax=hydrocarbon metagenome TaxID=938273 RepID=A0A0W8FUG9_9ZZZZ